MPHKTQVIILGGGISGLSYAYSLLKRDISVTIYEKESLPGGLMKSFFFGDFTFDFGPHVLRSRDKEVMKFVKRVK